MHKPFPALTDLMLSGRRSHTVLLIRSIATRIPSRVDLPRVGTWTTPPAFAQRELIYAFDKHKSAKMRDVPSHATWAVNQCKECVGSGANLCVERNGLPRRRERPSSRGCPSIHSRHFLSPRARHNTFLKPGHKKNRSNHGPSRPLCPAPFSFPVLVSRSRTTLSTPKAVRTSEVPVHEGCIVGPHGKG